jgi:hypothetical protein
MNDIKQTDGTPRFIGLKVPDEVPPRSISPNFDYLVLRFLDTVFSDVRRSELD